MPGTKFKPNSPEDSEPSPREVSIFNQSYILSTAEGNGDVISKGCKGLQRIAGPI